MHCYHIFHPFISNCFCKFSNNISFWPHLGCTPFGIRTIPHWKTIMMLCYWSSKFCSRSIIQICPLFCIKFFSSKHWYKIFVSKFRWMTIMFTMIIKLRTRWSIHPIRIPRYIGSSSWNRIDSPMSINSKLCFFKPIWCLMLFY